MKDEEGDITIDTSKTEIRSQYKLLYANMLGNREETYNFLNI